VTSPPPAQPGHGHRAPPARDGVSRVWQTDELPGGVDALASADGSTIMVRASLDRDARKRAVHEVMATIRRSPGLAGPPPAMEHASYPSP
jgi:hypothetical protein